MSSSKTKKNVFISFGCQFIIIALGIIIPRIMLVNYGSDINGLTGTITQIFTYMALLEAGIGQATKNALYKPIADNDNNGISYIVSVSRMYFRKITVFYGLGVLILSILIPFILRSDVNKITIFFVVLFEGMGGVISFYFSATWQQVFLADGRGYVKSSIDAASRIISYIIKIVLACLGMNIAIIQLCYFILTISQVIIYKKYFDKHYSWIKPVHVPKTAVLKDRNAYILSEVAWTIFSSTDMIVLSTFVSTQMSSVYSIYNLVFNNLSILLNAVYTSTSYMLGQAYYENKQKYIKLHDSFTSVYLGTMTILMSISYLLIIPFIKLYTSGVKDINYIYPLVPLFFCLIQMISWSRYITGNLTAIAGYAKKTSRISLIEAIINVVLSTILVWKFGIIGVLVATVVALPLKVIYVTHLSDKVILNRSYNKTLLILGGNYLVFALVVMVNKKINLNISNYFDFIKCGITITCVVSVLGIIVNFIVNPDFFDTVKEIIKNKINKVKK